jgi:hypothetical protein
MAKRAWILLILCAPATQSLGQSFNIAIGNPGDGPSSNYAAAMMPGVWNVVQVPHTTPSLAPQPFDEPLVDIHGLSSGVGIHQFGGFSILLVADPQVTGDDAVLLREALMTYSIGLKSCLYINGLQNGQYEVILYTWVPGNAVATNVSFVDFVPGFQFAGGNWTGQHEEGVTYARFIVPVTNGFLGPHAGIPDGGSTAIGGALNGLQVRLIGPPADGDNDGDVDADDVAKFNACLTGPNAEHMIPGCVEFDLDGDEDVDFSDFAMVQTRFTGS